MNAASLLKLAEHLETVNPYDEFNVARFLKKLRGVSGIPPGFEGYISEAGHYAARHEVAYCIRYYVKQKERVA